MRGNRDLHLRHVEGPRSIPACAGEPFWWWNQARGGTVYPRECGGTESSVEEWHEDEGLSPRVRGNLVRVDAEEDGARSIPACAGEPLCFLVR